VQSEQGSYRTITIDPTRDPAAAERANEKGLRHLKEGDLDNAAAAFGKALDADVEHGKAHNNLGMVYLKQGKLHDAAWEFEYARKLLPDEAEPVFNLGLVYEKRVPPKFDRAVDYFRDAVRLDPDNVKYRGHLARALIRRGDETPEVRRLLQYIIDNDARPDWVAWAQQQHARLNFKRY